MSRLDREKWRQEICAKFTYHVDIVPPPTGYSRREEEEIMSFLESRIGTFDLFGAIADGTAFIRYCFEHAVDAQAFRERFGIGRDPFASGVETATLKKAV